MMGLAWLGPTLVTLAFGGVDPIPVMPESQSKSGAFVTLVGDAVAAGEIATAFATGVVECDDDEADLLARMSSKLIPVTDV